MELTSISRGNWEKKFAFIFSCIGYAVGYGNIWRFPYLCYKNGGAAFLIPYAVSFLVLGFPLFFLELSLGQYTSLGPNILFKKLSPMMGGVGWGMFVVSLQLCIYYIVLFDWSLFYLVQSFTTVPLPWSHCDNDFNTESCYVMNTTVNNDTVETRNVSAAEEFFKYRLLQMRPDLDFPNLGDLVCERVWYLAASWIIVFICIIKGIQSSGRVVYFTVIVPYIILTILLIKGVTSKGALEGLEFYILKPNITKLTDPDVWTDAAGQVFFSLSIAYGGLIVLSSYNLFTVNILRDAVVISITNCVTSIFAGFVIFSVLGFMADQSGEEVAKVVSSGSGLVFVAYPTALASLPYPQFFSVLFFLMMLVIGIDSTFASVQCVITCILDVYPGMRKHQIRVTATFCFVCFLCGLPFCFQGGVYIFEIFFQYSGWLSLVFFALFETITVSYLYGFDRFMKNIIDEMKVKVPRVLQLYFCLTWKYLAPICLLVLLAASNEISPARFGDQLYPSHTQYLRWGFFITSAICVPTYALHEFCRLGHKSWKYFKGPTPDFKPAHELQDILDLARMRVEGNPSAPSLSGGQGYVNEAFTLESSTNL